ncbi:MAG TPA: aldo/keto reductase [Chloroflexota bacterium]|nr:aldo/keto reductase [Chloroflexota bacterium]
MRYRTLGKTGLRVSELGIGGAQIGLKNYMAAWDPASDASVAQIEGMLDRALDLGYNYVDTAPSYGAGRSEEIIGRVAGRRRAEFFLATKTSAGTWAKGKAEVKAEAEASLRRLQSEYVDVLQFHGGDYRPEQVRHLLDEGPADAYRDLREEGKVRFLGITAEEPVTLRPLIASGLFDVIQIRFNVIYQNAYHNILPEAQQAGLGVVVMRPATSGTFPRLLQAVCPEVAARCEPYALALNFVLSAPQVSVAIVGTRTIEEVEMNNRLSDDTVRRIDLDWLHQRYVSAGNGH